MDVLDACDGTAKGGLLLHAASMRQLAHGVTENGAMDDSADVSATRYGTTPPGDFVRQHLGWIQKSLPCTGRRSQRRHTT